MVDAAIRHGLLYRAKLPAGTPGIAYENTHAPFTLFPTLFPQALFEQAAQLQPLQQQLLLNQARDSEWFASVLDPMVATDPFTSRLYALWKACYVAATPKQTTAFGIFRSDYLLQDAAGGGAKIHDLATWQAALPRLSLHQVEFNTIAASFANLSERVGRVHDYLRQLMPSIPACRPALSHVGAPPRQDVTRAVADGFAEAHRRYGVPQAVVLMVVQPNERNAFDQRYTEHEVLARHGIQTLRATLADVARSATLVGPEDRLMVPDTLADGAMKEVAIVYFRAGYAPTDYPTEAEWEARRRIEQSYAITCPNLGYHLLGSKKFQQVLAMPGVLERFLDDPATEAAAVRACFAGLYPLDDTAAGQAAFEAACTQPERYVLKPSREGGGNNLYGEAMVDFLRSASPEVRASYILMDLIQAPHLRNVVVRDGRWTRADVVSELGVYGYTIAEQGRLVKNEVCGYLMRTKTSDAQEGGVAAGYAFLDTPCFVPLRTL
ncbi:hypothetical protein CXG81DRAFT_8841 [Caulochytrium protostelioides]|uniref:Glutathione synthetase n=1 Tax=Caulochytrium protostelioides TaxID=1555241 RepID=A0A4P9XEQ1_9FUNG|nr:hypothetical protein CXG81DRAFT_8841 [Caulochytrium protostelioides]|eukprot:RKP04008.1 hypothetical protein CXG81DRAFT_8841 [Caulochytrium protostelioides]